jgi:hypothetical protein
MVVSSVQLPVAVIGDLNQVAPETLPDHSFQLPDFQYGDPAEVFATAAALNIQVRTGMTVKACIILSIHSRQTAID